VEWDRALLAVERERHLLRALVAQCRKVLTCVRRPSRGLEELDGKYADLEKLHADMHSKKGSPPLLPSATKQYFFNSLQR
jgi:hypothetical protein